MSLKVINRTVAIVALLVIAICIIYGASELQGMGILVLIGYVVAIAPFIVTTFFPFFKKTKRNTIIGIVVIAIFLSFSVYCLLRYDLGVYVLLPYVVPIIIVLSFNKNRAIMCIGVNIYSILINALIILTAM